MNRTLKLAYAAVLIALPLSVGCKKEAEFLPKQEDASTHATTTGGGKGAGFLYYSRREIRFNSEATTRVEFNKHASKHFGIKGPWSPETKKIFEDKLTALVKNTNNSSIRGRYKKGTADVVHHHDRKTDLDVITAANTDVFMLVVKLTEKNKLGLYFDGWVSSY